MYRFVFASLFACYLVITACCTATKQSTQPTIAWPSTSAQQPVDLPGVPNVVAYTDALLCGGWPDSDAGLKTLEAMGIKTIIDVDGAKPDVERATALGMRYVHLPFGYDGVPRQRQLEIARALRDLPKPIYVHCHHGKHRSAAGLASACVTLGLMTPQQAQVKMHISGTSPSYKGLYASVTQATPASQVQLNGASNTYPSTWQTDSLVDAMVAIDAIADHLKDIAKANWQVPTDHPDLVPASEVAQLADLYRNLKDDPEVKKHPDELRDWFIRASDQATVMENQLVSDSTQIEKHNMQFKRMMETCKQCHTRYRN
jgi:protein tyrosine phosphatase (PTP) superfamily phosphohydrolase (DUF442 family)